MTDDDLSLYNWECFIHENIRHFTYISCMDVLLQQDSVKSPPVQCVSPSLFGIHIVDQLISLVDQRHQLLKQQLLSVFMGQSLLPLCTARTTQRSTGTEMTHMRTILTDYSLHIHTPTPTPPPYLRHKQYSTHKKQLMFTYCYKL